MLPRTIVQPASVEASIREKIAMLEKLLKEMVEDGVPSANLKLKETFTDGVYIREMFIPADTFVVGKIHKHDHLNYITKGRVIVLTKAGLEDLEGPCSMISTAGTKRALYTFTDTIWTTVHANPKNETDGEKLVSMLTVPDYELFPLMETVQIEEKQ